MRFFLNFFLLLDELFVNSRLFVSLVVCFLNSRTTRRLQVVVLLNHLALDLFGVVEQFASFTLARVEPKLSQSRILSEEVIVDLRLLQKVLLVLVGSKFLLVIQEMEVYSLFKREKQTLGKTYFVLLQRPRFAVKREISYTRTCSDRARIRLLLGITDMKVGLLPTLRLFFLSVQ